MKSRFICFALGCATWFALPAQDRATTNPSPVVSTQSVEVTVHTRDLGTEVYCYTWAISGNETVEAAPWNSCNTEKFRMSGSAGEYTIRIADIKQFYGMSDAQMESLTQLGFIAKTSGGAQSGDCMAQVVQGRRDFYSGGEGSAANPFILKTRDDLSALASTPGDWAAEYHFVLEADIEAGSFTGIGSKGTPFKAHFDGKGHIIKNPAIDGSATPGGATGLFNAIEGATIKNLGVAGADISGTTFTGALVGLAISGDVSACYTTGSVKATSICTGGLIGENLGANVSDCYSTASVANPGDYAVGGLVGKNKGVIKNTFASGKVTGHNYVGGLVGANYGKVLNSASFNAGMEAPDASRYVARFGGNDNSRNKAENNLSWAEIPNSQSRWADHGHHALGSADLRIKTTFSDVLGWNFADVWEWRPRGSYGYPALAGLGGQNEAPGSDNFYGGVAGTDGITADAAGTAVYPNPVETVLNVRTAMPLASYAVLDLSGARVLGAPAGGATALAIDMSGTAPGVYLLTLAAADGSVTVKKVIKK